uniref:Translation initiation factor eIF2B subunit alpha n=1 Tax=Rhodosorus marinus TaxID=101924 RepID=A0A7S3A194_9RHOD|mmetsp:Transcript_40931/g.162099  ORF Transcript_40931/g.162099 Transcript_40931/m.162099 type:complete len:282 (+) Transcript_40931:1092-1937(+)
MADELDKISVSLQKYLDEGMEGAQAAVQIMINSVTNFTAGTIMGLEQELGNTAELIRSTTIGSSIEIRACLETFISAAGRSGFGEQPDVGLAKKCIVSAGEAVRDSIAESHQLIAKHAHNLIQDGSRILTTSCSSAVEAILASSVATRKDIKVYVALGYPTRKSYEMVRNLQKLGVRSTVLPDSAVGSLVEQIDVVLVGAEAVMENGAVVNATGTFLLALAAKAAGKPLYVAVERYKFIRLYPLNQNDLRGKAHAFRLGETRNSISSVFIMRSSSHLGLQS